MLTAAGLFAAACVHSGPALHGPEDTARSYALALDEGRLDEAWALSTPLDRDRFFERYADVAVRHQRAEALLGAAQGSMTVPLALESGPSGWKVVEAPVAVPHPDDVLAARALVDHFLAAVQAGDFDAVYGDLASPWRARYTPGRLKTDFSSEPTARARLDRIRAALSGTWQLTAQGPQLALGDGLTLKLQREGPVFKVVSLE